VEKGVLLHFVGRMELERLFCGSAIVDLKLVERAVEERLRSYYWIMIVST
jgi:hypothetical protein